MTIVVAVIVTPILNVVVTATVTVVSSPIVLVAFHYVVAVTVAAPLLAIVEFVATKQNRGFPIKSFFNGIAHFLNYRGRHTKGRNI